MPAEARENASADVGTSYGIFHVERLLGCLRHRLDENALGTLKPLEFGRYEKSEIWQSQFRGER